MKKCVFVLRIDNYRPDLCEFTLPTIKSYAKRIGAEYREITARDWSPRHPPTFEKLQVSHLGAENHWNILVDADIMLNPELHDVTLSTPVDHVASSYSFRANSMFLADKYFLRDGRNIGIAGGFVVSSHLTHDLWRPPSMPLIQLLERTKRSHIVDEYVISRNLAKYGLKHTGIMDKVDDFIVHLGTADKSASELSSDVDKARDLIKIWNHGA